MGIIATGKTLLFEKHNPFIKLMGDAIASKKEGVKENNIGTFKRFLASRYYSKNFLQILFSFSDYE